MQITVLHNYGGKATNERRIVPGVYDSEDPALFGLAEYLIENGHAVEGSGVVQHDPVAQPEPQPAPMPVRKALTLEELNRDQIKARLDLMNIEYDARRGTESLRALLEENL